MPSYVERLIYTIIRLWYIRLIVILLVGPFIVLYETVKHTVTTLVIELSTYLNVMLETVYERENLGPYGEFDS